MKKNSILMFAFSVILLTFGPACQVLKSTEIATADKPAANTAATNSETVKNTEEKPKTDVKKGVISPSDKADFTFTAEALHKEFKLNKEEKYLDKIIAVSGRIKKVDLEKSSLGFYSVKLGVGEMFEWVDCGVSEENKDEIVNLKENQQVTLKGLGDSAWLIGPRLEQCIVQPDSDTAKTKANQLKNAKPDFSMTTEELVKAKKENKDSIEPPDKYKGKIIEVWGSISQVSPATEEGLPSRLRLNFIGGEPVIGDVVCEFDAENEAEFKTLHEIQIVKLKGLVSENWAMNPTLKHCLIVKKFSN